MTGFFVTGTDTGVGKTFAACALLHRLCMAGVRAVGMKPVVAGAEALDHGMHYADVTALQAASGVSADLNWVNPYRFAAPIAPHVGALRAGERIELDKIEQAYRRLAALADVVIVEGVGGWRVPLNEQEDTADMAQRLALPVVLVVGMRLGCLNHALLTRDAVLARGLQFAGWIANRVDAQMLAYEENLEALRLRLEAPLIGILPHVQRLDSREVAPLLDIKTLGVTT